EAQVRSDRPGEQVGLLRDETDQLGQLVAAEVRDGHTVDEDLSLLWVDEPGDEVDDRRLAGTGRTDDRGRRARSGGEVQVFEDGDLGAGVSEGDVAELELASTGDLVDACRDSHTGAGVEHLCDAFGA